MSSQPCVTPQAARSSIASPQRRVCLSMSKLWMWPLMQASPISRGYTPPRRWTFCEQRWGCDLRLRGGNAAGRFSEMHGDELFRRNPLHSGGCARHARAPDRDDHQCNVGCGEDQSCANGAVCSSKFAVEALSEALAQEMKPFGVRVVSSNPGPSTREWHEALKSFQDPPSIRTQSVLRRCFRLRCQPAPVLQRSLRKSEK
jgi:NAD(P)-dependent dehydrogenase (short-subunit alcohol dehydrogenase family)